MECQNRNLNSNPSPVFKLYKQKEKEESEKKKKKEKKKKSFQFHTSHFPTFISIFTENKIKKKKKPKIQQTLSLLSHRSVRSPKSRARVSAFNDQKFRPFLFLQKDRSETKRHYSELRSLSLSLTELCDLPKEISTTFSHTIVLWILQVRIFNPHSFRTSRISSNLRASYRSDGQYVVVVVIIFLKCRSVDLNDLWELSLPKNKKSFYFYFYFFVCVKIMVCLVVEKMEIKKKEAQFRCCLLNCLIILLNTENA